MLFPHIGRLARDYERRPETLAHRHLVAFTVLLLGNTADLRSVLNALRR